MNKLSKAIMVLLIALTLLSAYVGIQELGGSTVCLVGEGGQADCNAVQNSEYGQIAGIKVSILGPIAIIVLTLLYFVSKSKHKYNSNAYELFLLGTIIGGLGAVYFLFVQAFILKTFCSTCVAIDTTMIVITILAWIDKKIT